MTDFFMYLLKASLVFTLLFMVYKIILSRFTFHAINRVLLIALIPTSLILPLSHYIIPNSFQITEELPFMEYVMLDSITEIQVTTSTIENNSINYWEIATIAYVLITFLFIFRSILTVRKLWGLKNVSRTHRKKGHQIIETETAEVFSFFRWIFVPKGSLNQLDPIIIKHEKIHIRLKHSLDIVLTEIYTSFFWFNPFMYAFKKSLKSIHEFQVDERLLQKEVQPLQYMQLLLENLTNKKQNVLYNYFSHPILKKRVDMMTRNKSHGIKKFTYLIVLPISIFLCMAFGKETYNIYQEIENIDQQETTFLFPIQNGSSKDITSHFGVKRKILKKKQKRIHQGIDIKANEGTAVLAASDGVIVKASKEGNWGNLIIIKHANGYETWYAHLKDFKIAKNQKVKRGDIIGLAGNTGLATGPHLHYELKYQGKNINPLSNIKE